MITSLQVYRPGIGWIIPLEDRVTLQGGDVLSISVSVPYKGPAGNFTLYGAIGSRDSLLGISHFNEIIHGEANFPCPASPSDYTTVTGTVDILIVTGIGGIAGGVNYDIMAKIYEHPSVSAEVDNVVDIEGGGGVVPGITDIMGPMMAIMMFAMIMPMFSGEGGMFGGGEEAGLM